MLFKRYKKNPILSPDPDKDYECMNTYNPCTIVHNNRVYMVYRAEGKDDVSVLCMAVSDDGYNFRKSSDSPVISPSIPEEKGGCEDPRIMRINDLFYLTYTAYNGEQPVDETTINTALAVSNDLVHWQKKGILIRGIKAATIYPKKIRDKFVMFIGGENIRLGWSTNLHDWTIDKSPVLDVRDGMFDDRYVEVGMAPFEFRERLVLFFNTANKQGVFHPSLALFDKENPRKVLYRANEPLMSPTEKYEIQGKVKNVIFGSGLTEFKGTYFFYYGAADRYVGLATVSKEKMESYLSSIS